MKGFRWADQANILSLVMALTLAWVGRPAAAGPAGYIDTYAGGGFSKDGDIATSVGLGYISCLTASDSGTVYFTALDRVWKINSDGTLKIVAGTGEKGFSGDGGRRFQLKLTTFSILPWISTGIFSCSMT